MTSFEQMLINKGYIKFILNAQKMTFDTPKGEHSFSYLGNIFYAYIHKTEEDILNKIHNQIPASKIDTADSLYITFGLHEAGSPPTLIAPRPRIEIIKIRNGQTVIDDEWHDSSMLMAFERYSNDEIFTAMFDKSKKLTITLND